ncbi:unnamed protein product [Rotaria sp. Silwood2]|nr:unnamed protein product [Rotaria sp. Silwood2]CAF2521837.1 unnamed protein product [Rotaria sp. Silwood2]CAF3909206.1 unnamed protein product [Rotaria sp. Silwood2]CAF3955427.1 unnamed protein product [Rotaria sp. Silwood2]CAF4251292.1 unnamed protein product [Rotaria sp. Silwood2]
MPEIGSCTDVTCNEEIKDLYECHCCLRLVCLNHLIEHVEITKQNKKRLHMLGNELNTVITTLELIIEEKLVNIEREEKLIEGAKKIDVLNSSTDEIQNILEQINQAISSNHSDETIVKVESSLLETKNCSCICTCNKKKTNSIDQSSPRKTRSKSKSATCLDSTIKTGVREKLGNPKNGRYSTLTNRDFFETVLFDQTQKSTKDQDINEEQNKIEAKSCSTYFGKCPLVFDGAYGLTNAKHSIDFCLNKRSRRIGLYAHFVGKHTLKAACARRLVQAIVKNKDPMITKLFEDNEDVINHFYRISCPFRDGMINLFGCNKKTVSHVPCGFRSVVFSTLKFHLKHYHNVSGELAQTLVNYLKEIQISNDVTLT